MDFNEVSQAFTQYAEAGIIVHPLAAPDDEKAGKGAGKAPILKNWTMLTESAPIEKFSKNRNIGAVCGKCSDLTVIDVDYYFKGLWEYVFENCDTSQFVKQAHTEKRWHWLFKYNEALAGKQYQELGFDILSGGANCVMSPSRHRDGSCYQIFGSAAARTETPQDAVSRLLEVLKIYREFKDILLKCRPAWQGLWKAVFTQREDELYRDPWAAFRGEEGRKRHLGFCSELLANGAEEKHLIFTAWLIFPESFSNAETVKNLKGVNPKATWKNSTIQNDETLSRFFKTTESKTADPFSTGFGPVQIAEALQAARPVYFDKARNFWLWDPQLCNYERTDETEILCAISDLFSFKLCEAKLKSAVLEALRITGRSRRVKPIKKSWVQFLGSVYDLETGAVFTSTPDYFFASPIPHKLGTSADTPIIDKLFNDWVNDRAPLLTEICAYCLLDDYPVQRIFAFPGAGSNGKSQFLDLVKALVGNANCTAVDLEKLTQTQFESSKLYQKKVAFVGDAGYGTLSKTYLLKLLTGGDLVSAEFKGRDSFDFVNTAKIFIATNGLPETRDMSDGFYRRWCITEFKNTFPDGGSVVAGIPETEYENLCFKCLSVLRTILDQKKLPHEDPLESRKTKYETLSNPIKTFIESECDTDTDESVPVWYLYEKYQEYRQRKHQRDITKDDFSKTLKRMGFEAKRVWYSTEEQKKYTETVAEGSKQWRAFSGLSLKSFCDIAAVVDLHFETSPVSDNLFSCDSCDSKNPIAPSDKNTIVLKNACKELAVTAVTTPTKISTGWHTVCKTSDGSPVTKNPVDILRMFEEEGF